MVKTKREVETTNVIKSNTKGHKSYKDVLLKDKIIGRSKKEKKSSTTATDQQSSSVSDVQQTQSDNHPKSNKITANWEKLKKKIHTDSEHSTHRSKSNSKSLKRKHAEESVQAEAIVKKPNVFELRLRDKIVAIDCEMVGVGFNGKTSALARCSVVDFDGNVLYDQYVRPKGHVTNYRTRWSGITKEHLKKSNSVTLEECQNVVVQLIKDKIVVGHALQNDWRALMLSHPMKQIRDTAFYKPYMTHIADTGKYTSRSLKELSKEYLGLEIQKGPHNSVEDAKASLMLYKNKMEEWESELRSKHRDSRKKQKKNDGESNEDQKPLE